VIDVLDDIAGSLVMTVHPGFGGQQLISACLDLDESVPAASRSIAIGERFSWRGEADFASCLLAALRFQFVGHVGHVGHEEQWP